MILELENSLIFLIHRKIKEVYASVLVNLHKYLSALICYFQRPSAVNRIRRFICYIWR
jgi:hypothetical protein